MCYVLDYFSEQNSCLDIFLNKKSYIKSFKKIQLQFYEMFEISYTALLYIVSFLLYLSQCGQIQVLEHVQESLLILINQPRV